MQVETVVSFVAMIETVPISNIIIVHCQRNLRAFLGPRPRRRHPGGSLPVAWQSHQHTTPTPALNTLLVFNNPGTPCSVIRLCPPMIDELFQNVYYS